MLALTTPRLGITLALVASAIALFADPVFSQTSRQPTTHDGYEVDLAPSPPIAGEPIEVVVTALASGCGEPTLRELFRTASLVLVEYRDPGCPILPPPPVTSRARTTIDPLLVGDWTFEIRDPGGHVLHRQTFTVFETRDLEVVAAPDPATTADSVRLDIRGLGECGIEIEELRIDSTGELGEIEAVIASICLLDPPPPLSEFDLAVDLGPLPVGKYRVRVSKPQAALVAGDSFEVVPNDDRPLFTIPEEPTNRDTQVTLVLNLPGRATCNPLEQVRVQPTHIRVEVDDSCLRPNPDSRASLFAEIGPLAAGRYDIVAVDRNSDELLRGEISVAEGGDCVPSETTLCLGGGRFRVVALFQTPTGVHGPGHARQQTRDSGAFWFFGPDNTELDVKVLDGCGVNSEFWVFVAGLTHVRVRIDVTDTVTGVTKTYVRGGGAAFEPIQDTAAFPCP